MLESAWLFIGLLAVLTTGAALFVDDDGLAIVFGALGFVVWGIWTYGSLEIIVVDNGAEITFTHPELVILGIALALVPGYIMLTGPVELAGRGRETDIGADDI